jgi:hypothetical protein
MTKDSKTIAQKNQIHKGASLLTKYTKRPRKRMCTGAVMERILLWPN